MLTPSIGQRPFVALRNGGRTLAYHAGPARGLCSRVFTREDSHRIELDRRAVEGDHLQRGDIRLVAVGEHVDDGADGRGQR